MAEGGSQSCETQKNEISELLRTQLKKGDTWYLADTKWFKQWKKFVGYDTWDTSLVGDDSANPGPIDNSPLLKEGTTDGSVRENLIDELDYMLVPTEAWNKLVQWYGIAEGQKTIARTVIEQGMFVKHCKVEVYLMDLTLCDNSNPQELKTHQFSRAATIDTIEKEMKTLYNIDDNKEVRLWNKYMSNTYEHLNKPENTVQDAGLYHGQVIVIEQKNEDGSWPRQIKTSTTTSTPSTSTGTGNNGTEHNATASRNGSYSSSYASSSTSSYYNYSDSYKSTSGPGLCGLSNLGNTCFMNAALQCMSNVPPLTDYFLSSKWKDELNYENPLGMKGEIATSYAELVAQMWSGKCSYTVPRNFKISVGRFAPQFSGYQQQDSQELMAFLLDGLHEDLNRVKKKPYVEQKDTDGRKDKSVALEAWDNYRKRNDSVIVDTFHGLLKSTLVCPECTKVSVTFDPFCYLSLPLPIKKERQIEVFLVPLDAEQKPTQYKLTVPKMGIVADLCKALCKLTEIPPEKMVVTDVYNHRFHKVFSPDEGLNHILDRDDIFIYETPVSTGDHPDVQILPVYMREKKLRQGYNNYSHETKQLFGQPLLVPVPKKNCTYDVLYNCVLDRMARYVTRPADNHDWWKSTKTSKGNEAQVNGEENMSNDEENNDETGEKSTKGVGDGTNDNEGSTASEPESSKSQKPRLFSFHLVNSYGSAEVEGIKDDGKPIKLTTRSYIALDWNMKAKSLFFDEKAAEAYDTHESMDAKIVQKKTIQLTECLELFTKEERLGEQDLWYCPSCKKHQQATKKFDLWSLPKILVIHLKRFSYNRYWRDKLDTFIEYPTRGLDMKKYIINEEHGPAMYDLTAVSNHYGGMGGGHYTAYAKNKGDGDWYYFDDSSVSSATEDSVVTKAGYVLVYQRREPGAQQKSPPAAAVGSPSTEMAINNGDHREDEDMDINYGN